MALIVQFRQRYGRVQYATGAKMRLCSTLVVWITMLLLLLCLRSLTAASFEDDEEVRQRITY